MALFSEKRVDLGTRLTLMSQKIGRYYDSLIFSCFALCTELDDRSRKIKK